MTYSISRLKKRVDIFYKCILSNANFVLLKKYFYFNISCKNFHCRCVLCSWTCCA